MIIIIAIILFPSWLYYEHEGDREAYKRKSRLKKCLTMLFFVIIGIILLPVFVGVGAILLAIPGSCMLVAGGYRHVIKCWKSRQMRKNKLRIQQ